MKKEGQKPTNLGDKLEAETKKPVTKTAGMVILALGFGIVVGAIYRNASLGIVAAGAALALAIFVQFRHGKNEHFLLRFDRQGFMADLELTQKTAVFDGSNIYHFGLDRKLGPLPLGALIAALRSEGYRIVCFFDANIYFALRENGDLPEIKGQFSPRFLQSTFDLNLNEIYVVPKGVQADDFVVECLTHLPVSFAVTNDRYRDFHDRYPLLTENKDWRKGVRLNGENLLLYQHKFKFPLIVR